ncbi:MAG: hypothetical protein HQ567_24350 [Candidatus Nealsonbacteria bacterium]|nr:hypothetical protein [Candidatus Nealsonbacteria bacterium]
MSGLTVTEKEHWKSRIARRIDKRVEAITAGDPNFFERIERDARQRALESLSLAEYQTELDEIERQKETMEKRAKRLHKAMLAKVRGVEPDDLDDYFSYRHDSEVDNAVKRRKAVHEDELLAESELGQQVLRLRQEKDELQDVVWLASSCREVKALWGKVTELLGDEQTQLQKDALAIKAIADD